MGGNALKGLTKKSMLGFRDFYRPTAFLVLIYHDVDPRADWIATHVAGIVGLQQIGDCSDVLHSGVEPKIITVGVEDDGHPVVDS